MKAKLFYLFMFLSNIMFSQTEELEKLSLSNRFSNGEFSLEAYKVFANEWRNMLDEFGGYPMLPYDEARQQIRFNFIQKTNQTKSVNYNRILEWAAINFGSISSVLHYQDFESGKIVLKGSFDVSHKSVYKNFWGKPKEGMTTTKCLQTYIFTVIENSVKIEIFDVRYEIKLYGYYSSSTYIPERVYEIPIHNIYPITNFASSEWKEKLDLLNQTNNRIESLTKNLEEYIKDYIVDYKF